VAIVTVTEKQWGEIFTPKVQKQGKTRGRGPVTYRFRRVGRAFKNTSIGPGRKAKSKRG